MNDREISLKQNIHEDLCHCPKISFFYFFFINVRDSMYTVKCSKTKS
jgi:hypothetical protein